jgi:AraC family transcriptional regulator
MKMINSKICQARSISVCASIDFDVVDNPFGVVTKTIPGGKCAVLRHIGSNDNIGESIRFLYAEWLPQSGAEPRDFPLYFQRVSFFPDVPEHEAITDIFLPIS